MQDNCENELPNQLPLSMRYGLPTFWVTRKVNNELMGNGKTFTDLVHIMQVHHLTLDEIELTCEESSAHPNRCYELTMRYHCGRLHYGTES